MKEIKIFKNTNTYSEYMRQKRCINLLKYYELTKKEILDINDFLEKNDNGLIVCKDDMIYFLVSKEVKNTVFSHKTDESIKGIMLNKNSFDLINYY